MNSLINILTKSGLLTKDLDYHLLRASMVIIFLFFGYQKWFEYEAQVLIPYISNGPLIYWMYPVFGIRGASWFLGVSEWLFGALLFFGFWNKKLGILGALGSCVTFIMAVTIIPFMPNGWAASAGGFPAMVGNVPFLMKDVVLFAASVYLLKQDVLRVSLSAEQKHKSGAWVPSVSGTRRGDLSGRLDEQISGGHTMTTVKLFPEDIYNQKTISQGHPPGWTNRQGGEYDLVVLGGGPAGLVAAITAAAGGHRVAMTEQRLTGGTCVNFGCTPSKALIRCARAIHDSGRGAEFGFRLDGPSRTDFGAVMERVRRMRSRSSEGDAVQAVEKAGVEVYLGHTRFTAPNVVEVDGRQLRFRKAVIATGSDPLVPPIDGLKTGEYLTNESVFSLTELPARLVVIGGGPLACELAQAFHRLGSEVDLVSDTETLLSHDEPEASALIRRRIGREGLRLHLGCKAVRAGGGRLTVQGPAGTRELAYDSLLLGTGRKANVDGLSLEAAGVRLDKDGVEVDEYLRTSNPDIYATGDVAFPEKFTHAAMATARLCIANALDGANRRAEELVIPHCTYTDPEVAQVGLTPRRAREQGVPIDAYRLDLAKVERAFIDGEEEGFAAIYTRRGSGEMVGATLVAAHAGEMISELTLAITNKVPLEGLAETVHCYPTQAEVFQRVALQYAGTRKTPATDEASGYG